MKSEEGYEQSHHAITCPHCKSDRIEFVACYYKQIGARIARELFIFASIICFAVFLFSLRNEPNASALIVGAILLFIALIVHLRILFFENGTHIKAICRDCGHIWLLD